MKELCTCDSCQKQAETYDPIVDWPVDVIPENWYMVKHPHDSQEDFWIFCSKECLAKHFLKGALG